MAEHEIAKHTKKVVTVLKSPDDIKHKIKDILMEIAIIVFAITLSLLVERWREHSQEQTLEHNFLTSLVKDLKADELQLKQDSASYVMMHNGFEFYRKAYNGTPLNADSAVKLLPVLYNTVVFVPSSSRYEALKASGKLDVIEDTDLQIAIVNLYQQTVPSLIASTASFAAFKEKLGDHIDGRLTVKGGQNNIQQLMQSPVTYNMLARGGFINNIVKKYHLTLQQTRNIITKIEAKEH